MELYCIDCGAPIKYSGRGRPPVYCAECRKQHDKLTRKKAYRKYMESEKGQKWLSEYMKSDSRKASDRKYYQNNKQSIKERQQRYCQTESGKRSRQTRKARRRAREAGVEHEPWTREEIIKRDKGICQVCGLPVYDYDDAPKRLKPQIDHIVPISAGGADKADNLRLTHAFCNNHKHAGEADVEHCKSVISSELEALAEKLL